MEKEKKEKPLGFKRLRTTEGIINDPKLWKVFEHACHLQCSATEICCLLDISQVQLERACAERYDKSFKDAYIHYSEGGKMMLRRYQLDLAKKSASMAIWLGKQWLKQRDNPEDISEFNGKLGELLDVLKGDPQKVTDMSSGVNELIEVDNT